MEFIQKLLKNIPSGIGLGLGILIVLLLADYADKNVFNNDREFGNTGDFELTSPELVKSGNNLIVTGEILLQDFSGVLNVLVGVNIFEGDKFIQECHSDTVSDLDGKWYYWSECDGVTKDFFDQPYKVMSKVSLVILKRER